MQTPSHRKCHVSDRNNRKRVSPCTGPPSGLESPPLLVPISMKKYRGHNERSKQHMIDYAKSVALSVGGLFDEDLNTNLLSISSRPLASAGGGDLQDVIICSSAEKSHSMSETGHSEALLQEYFSVMFEWMCSMEDGMSFGGAIRTVLEQWRNAFHWFAILTPPVVAFSDNVGTVQVVSGQSMSPTLNPNPNSMWLDVVFVSRVSNFSKGDVVLLPEPVKEKRTRIVKRVASVSSDASSVYVLGDNSLHSTDSRQFGHVPSCLIEGVVKYVVFPPWRIRSL